MQKVFNYFLFIVLLSCSNNKEKESTYIPVENWPKIPNNYELGNPTGLALKSNQNLIVFHRGSRSWQTPMPKDKIKENTIIEIDNSSGEIINAWGADMFIMPHGLEIDNENNIWITDVGLHQVIKYDSNGKELMVLGKEFEPGSDSYSFNLPTDVAVANDGSFYVSDGYGNSRIIKFSKDGSYQFEWGAFGNEKSQFNIPHGLDLDNNGNVYVADRENNRIQKFDSLGNFIAEWKNQSIGQLYSVNVNNYENYILGIDYIGLENMIPIGSDIIYLDLELNVKSRFGRSGSYDGQRTRYHDIQIDERGNMFVGDILNNSIQKFIPIQRQ